MTCTTDCLKEGRFELLLDCLMRNRDNFYVRLSNYAMTNEECAEFKERLMFSFDMIGVKYLFTEQGARMKILS